MMRDMTRGECAISGWLPYELSVGAVAELGQEMWIVCSAEHVRRHYR